MWALEQFLELPPFKRSPILPSDMDLSHLHALLPDADHGFSMKMKPSDPGEFFRNTNENEKILAERSWWLQEGPGRCVAVDEGTEAVVDHVCETAVDWGSLAESDRLADCDTLTKMVQLGRCWEPDFMVVVPDVEHRFRLRAGCVCFPSSWSLTEKIGEPLETIHGVVPGLNSRIGNQINSFLGKMKPNVGWLRANWGISSSPERNQHPARRINRLCAGTEPETTWLRIEHQLLVRLGATNAILFGIRLENVPMNELKGDGRLRKGLKRALETMPVEMQRYKNLESIQPKLVDYLTDG